MAIRKSFGGSNIYQPGAYSRFKTDNSSGSALGTNDVLFLVGESTKGAPGSSTGITEWSAERIGDLIATYGEGPLVDCVVASARGSVTPNVGSPGRYLIYKTNASTQAQATLTQSASNQFTVKGRAYGAGDNDFSVVVAAGTTGDQKAISITELNGTTEVLGENDADDIISVQYTGDATTATITIAGASRAALTLTTTLAGDQTDGSVNLNITLQNYTMNELVTLINDQTGYTASLVTSTAASKNASQLDAVGGTPDVKTSAVTLQRLQYEVLELINTSTRVVATEAGIFDGVPDNQTVALTGGAQGASTNANFSTGFSVSLAEDYNVLLPCISRDASTDIADADLGFTDPASTYTISSVLSAAGAHLALRGNVKNRKEAQGFGGFRNAAKATCFNTIAALNDYNLQVTMQDTLFVDATGSTKVGQPHVLAAQCAGTRLGTDVGEPLTHKFLNTQGIGHVIDPTTLLATGDFNTALDADDAIVAGVLFAERKGSGYRIVVDNTTYGQDASFLYNRGSVIEATYFVNKDLRDFVDSLFIGKKVSNGAAQSIKTAIRGRMRTYNKPDVQITTSSDDAPEGFREDTFVVQVVGNTVEIQLEFRPVQGLDFVLFTHTVGEAIQTA